MTILKSYYNDINHKAIELRKVGKRYQVIEGFKLSSKLKTYILDAMNTPDYSKALNHYKALTN